MALSGSYNTNKYTTSSHGTIGLNLSWTGTQSITNNTTTIKWTLKSNGSMSSGYYVQAGPITVTINGTKVLNTTSRFNMYGDGKYKKSGTITIPHNADGTKTITLSVAAAIYSASVNCRYPTGGGSASITLDKIDRYALIASVTDFTNESYPKIVYTNPAGTALTTGLKARITWKDTNDVEHATSWVNTLNDEGGEYTFTSSTLTAQNIADMLAACPENNALSVKFQLRSTMGGVDYDDYKTAVMSVVNSAPVFTVNPSYLDANTSITAITENDQIIVRKQSKLRIYHGTAAAQNGASLMPNPYIINFNGASYGFMGDYVEFDKPDIAGTYRATVIAMDTRENTTTAYIDITVLDWTKPTLDCELERQNSFETKCDLFVTPHYSSVNNINSITITEKHRRANSSVWSTEIDITNEQSPIEISLPNNYEWEMAVTITDRFTSNTYPLSIGKGIPFIYKDFYRNSLAFNAIPDADNQVIIGEGCHAKVDGVRFPYVYSTSEQIVGYWLDDRPVYRKVIELTSDVSVNANAWKNSALTVSEDIIIVGGRAMYYSSQYDMFTIFNFIALQTNTSNKKAIDLYNARDTACTVNFLVIDYIKPTQNNS